MPLGANIESGTRDDPPLPVAYMVVSVGFIVSFAAFFYGFDKPEVVTRFLAYNGRLGVICSCVVALCRFGSIQ